MPSAHNEVAGEMAGAGFLLARGEREKGGKSRRFWRLLRGKARFANEAGFYAETDLRYKW
jgi:hypothetical protein